MAKQKSLRTGEPRACLLANERPETALPLAPMCNPSVLRADCSRPLSKPTIVANVDHCSDFEDVRHFSEDMNTVPVLRGEKDFV